MKDSDFQQLLASVREAGRIKRGKQKPARNFEVHVATGTVVEGKIVVEGLSLPEGTLVTVLTRDSEPTVRLSAQEEAELLDALDEADREEGSPVEELLERLRRHG